jgi:hypothetical protein
MNPLHTELTKQMEEAKAEGRDGVLIANSETLSADQIHRWFPAMEVKWTTTNQIQIRWSVESRP